jgi:hypothetical protein
MLKNLMDVAHSGIDELTTILEQLKTVHELELRIKLLRLNKKHLLEERENLGNQQQITSLYIGIL